MKKILSLLLALMLVFSLSVFAFAEGGTEEPAAEEPAAAEPAAPAEPEVPRPTVFKSPLRETVIEGVTGPVYFTAGAENFTSYTWRIVSPDGSDTVQAADVGSRFEGCMADFYDKNVRNDETGEAGKGTELVLYNITAEMDGWYVEVKFDNGSPNNYTLTDDAMLTVIALGETLDAPEFSVQPEGFELKLGETGTLSAAAATPGSAKTVYQWYANDTESTEGATLIVGATEKTYTPEQRDGTTYYFVEAYSAKGDFEQLKSETVVSDIVAVTYSIAPVEEELPAAPEETPAEPTVMTPDDPEVEVPESGVIVTNEENEEPAAGESGDAETAPEETLTPEEARNANSMKWLIYAGGALAAAAVIGGITALIVRRRGDDEYEDEDEDEDEDDEDAKS